MGKTKKTVFFCQSCGHESSKWLGQCPACKEWNSFVEEVLSTKSAKKTFAMQAEATPINAIDTRETLRSTTGFAEMDRVLGGGIVEGSLVLLGGDPGIGKSTLLLQVCRNLSNDGKDILYISGEESQQQIKMRAERMGKFSDHLSVLCETNLDAIESAIERSKPNLVVIDSIQTMYREEVASAPGSVSQVREATSALLMIAKRLGVTIFIVGHVTKEGSVAGPRVLEHMVDTVLYFEGDGALMYRILRGVKNRFGSTHEIGVFEMRGEGLVEVPNPSEFMLSGRDAKNAGSVVACLLEGTRSLLVEVQALVIENEYGHVQRTAAGTDYKRVNLLMAVMDKRLGVHLSHSDAYVNIAGGMKVSEPAIDLAIVLALLSSYRNRPVGEGVVAFGEVGLGGEVRACGMPEMRIAEAQRLGFTTCLVPFACKKTIEAHGKPDGDMEIVYVRHISDVAKHVV